MNIDVPLRKYAPLWSKYRPAVLKMMLAAGEQPQTYQLMQHEFTALDSRKKGGFGFSMSVAGRKATTNIKNSEVAQDLLHMLQLSRTGSELMAANMYEFSLDKQFKLHVTQLKPQPAEAL
jgi:hypothetical protein